MPRFETKCLFSDSILEKQGSVVWWENMEDKLPNCMKCKYYFVTYKKDKPFGCRAMGFVSKVNPARVVFTTSGMHCQKFTYKQLKRQKD